MIDAMPSILKRCADAVYVVACANRIPIWSGTRARPIAKAALRRA